ncbi:DNA primase (plasmid) [Pseudomonas fluorescens]|uniref:DNA primase n=1 Tax=Pseudomonas TaxID=286 RepID=UPI001F13F8D7|nr:DNA primase [Pseudomonas viridiflava]
MKDSKSNQEGRSKKMLSIPQHIIDRIVSQTDLAEVVGRYLKLKKQGADYIALCPFHREQSPSFSVSPRKQFFYCFGCGAGGNTLDFMQQYLSKSFIPVIQELAEEVGIDITPYLKSAQNEQLDFQIPQALADAQNFFRNELLRNHSDVAVATQYLSSRQVSAELSERFGLGFAGYGKRAIDALTEHHEVLIEIGLLQRNETGSIFSLFRDRLMMPVRDMRGKVIGVSGRTLDPEVKPKYRNSKESALFSRNSVLYGLYESMQAYGNGTKIERLFVVEGQFDVLANHMLNLAACAAMGSSVSVQQLRLMLRHAKRVSFLFDGDQAGRKALIQIGTLLLENITDHEVVFDVLTMPEGVDPHNMVTEQPDQYRAMLDQSQPWLDAFIQALTAGHDLGTDRGRAEYASAALDVIHDTRDPLLRHQAVQKLAAVAGLPFDALEERLKSMPAARSGFVKPQEQLNDASIRLARILWDEPLWAEHIENTQLWLEEGDEIIQTLAAWKIDLFAGSLDVMPSAEEQRLIESDQNMAADITLNCRNRGGAAALGRRLSGLHEGRLMESLMKEEPETSRATAHALALHITGICAGNGLQSLSKTAAMGALDDAGREKFNDLMRIRRDCINRTKNL